MDIAALQYLENLKKKSTPLQQIQLEIPILPAEKINKDDEEDEDRGVVVIDLI